MAWTRVVGVGLRALLARRIKLLSDTEHWARNSARLQQRELRWLIEHAAETEFGRRANFNRLKRLSDGELPAAYRAEVPVQSYMDLKPLLERMRQRGEPNVAWPGMVMDWAQTSGTTAGDKFVPISREMLSHNRKAAFDVYAHASRFGVSLPDVFAGKALFLGGSTDLEENEHGVRTGDLSGVVTRLIRWPITSVWLPGRDIALESDWPTKIERMARRCMNADVRWISGMPSWSIVLFERMAELARADGRQVRCLRDLWPNLRVFVHGGVKYGPFERRVREMWSGDPDGADIPNRLEVYAASEAFVATQDVRGEPGMRLNIDHRVHYEFVPLSEIDSADPPAFDCAGVERGERYVVVMSTCGGLWRYNIGDVVEFDTIPPDGPVRLRIVGRSRHFMNAFGENIIAEHIENAVTDAAAATGARVGEFTAAPVYPAEGRPSGIELAVEWEGATDPGLLARFAEEFDASIKRQNNDYTAKRSGGLGMGLPTVTALPMGAFHRWLDSRGKLGGQHKCPRCSNDRTIIEQVIGCVASVGTV